VLIGTLVALAVLAVPLAASARPIEAVSTYTITKNLKPMGYSAKTGNINSDLAFWGDRAYQGNFAGFRILDISSPANPRVINDYTQCAGGQGDVVVWGNILVRTWDAPAPPGATCDGAPVTPSGQFPGGFEGLHVFDISNPLDPDLVASVDMLCGSHTATGVPDLANGRLLIYNSNSNQNCPWFEIVEVPLASPETSHVLRMEPSDHTCHDIGVILGDVMKASCAGGEGFRVFGIGGESGGTLTDPLLLYHVVEPGVTIGHSAAWSWDGEIVIFGHEPGGGVLAECERTDPPTNYTYFFYDGDTGAKVGSWTLPRPQTSTENCTLHNLNVVPTDKRYVLVHGSYQSGTSVVDFTNPAAAFEVAFADPAPLSPTTLILGGDWSSYWYNGFIYESDINRGLIIWNLTGPWTASALKFDHLNPQTQETSFALKR
jgi:hypothetical protein